jgi:hypothetical protein
MTVYWPIPLAIVAYSGVIVLQRPAVTAALMLLFVAVLAPFFVGSAHFDDHTFWQAIAVLLGSLVGQQVVFVFELPRFIRPADLLNDRAISLRTALVLLCLVGSALLWALVPIAWLNWTMALLAYVLTLMLSTLVFSVSRRTLVPWHEVARAHLMWLLVSLLLFLALGITQSLVRYRFFDVVLVACFAGTAALIAVANALIPNKAPRLRDPSDALAAALDTVSSELAQQIYDQY